MALPLEKPICVLNDVMNRASDVIIYSVIVLSLFAVDYILGNGFMGLIVRVLCKVLCSVKKTIGDEQNLKEMAVSSVVLFCEILMLGVTIALLNKYKKAQGRDPIAELLKESKETLRQTSEFLEKLHMRRSMQIRTDGYFDDEPRLVNSLKLEVPILQMAIIDAISTTRTKMERGDAGDSVNVRDSTLLSVTSFFDEEFDSLVEPLLDDKLSEEAKTLEVRNRYLWDVMEEDSNTYDD